MVLFSMALFIPLAAFMSQTAQDDTSSAHSGIPGILDSMPEGSVSVTDHGTAAGTYVFWVTASDSQDHDREPYTVIVP